MKRSLLFVRAAGGVVAVAVVAVAVGCSSGAALKSPASDTQFDDSDDPGNGGVDPIGKGGDAGARDSAADAGPSAIVFPSAGPGIGFEDVRFSSALGRLIVPAGRSGNLDLVDPATGIVTAIGGFSALTTFNGGHADGAVSADDGNGFVFVADQTTKKLHVVDPTKKSIVASVDAASAPGFVRFVAPKNEVWVTEPADARIEVFSVSADPVPVLQHVAFIALGGAPAGLVIDAARGRAYASVAPSSLAAIDVGLRTAESGWPTGCAGVRGVAFDTTKNVVFAACEEGKAVSLDAATGATITSIDAEKGLDAIAFDGKRSHLYAPGATSGAMTILAVNASGQLAKYATLATVAGANAAVSDGNGTVYVADPAHGQLLMFRD